MPPAKSQRSASKKGKERRLSEQTPRKTNGERQRFVFADDQRKLLEEAFQRNKFVARDEKTLLAGRIGVSERSIKDWFYARRNKDKRRSVLDEPSAIELAASEAVADQVAPEVPDVEMDNDPSTPAPAALEPNTPAEEEGPNERIADGSQFVMDWRRGSALYQPPIVAVPQPISRRQTQVQAVENGLVEAGGRAMILRLRKLYEKDMKLFLHAQNDVSNAIFKYEVEDS